MSEVLERIRAKYPAYANVSDDKLTAAIGDKYPAYLDSDETFKTDFERVRYGATQEGLAQAEKLADVMAASKLTPAEKHSEFLTNLAGWMEFTASKLANPIRYLGELADIPIDATLNRNHPEYQNATANALSRPTVNIPRPGPEASPIPAGVADAGATIVEEFSKPENLVMLPAGVSKTVLAAWAALTASHTPQRILNANTLLKEGKTREAVNEMATGGGELLLSGLMARQAARAPATVPGEILNIEA